MQNVEDEFLHFGDEKSKDQLQKPSPGFKMSREISQTLFETKMLIRLEGSNLCMTFNRLEVPRLGVCLNLARRTN